MFTIRTIYDALILWLAAREIVNSFEAPYASWQEELVQLLVAFEAELYEKTTTYLKENNPDPGVQNLETLKERRRNYFQPLLDEFQRSTHLAENASIVDSYKQHIFILQAAQRPVKIVSDFFVNVDPNNLSHIESFAWERAYRNQVIEISAEAQNLKSWIEGRGESKSRLLFVKRLGDVVSVVEKGAEFQFTQEEAQTLHESLMRVIKKNQAYKEFQSAVINIPQHYPLLSAFFKLTNDEMIQLSRGTLSWISFLTQELESKEFKRELTQLIKVITPLGKIITLLNLVEDPPAEFRARLDYQITRPSRLLLALNPIKESLATGTHTYSAEELTKFYEGVDRVAKANLSINEQQTLDAYIVRLQRRIASLEAITGSFMVAGEVCGAVGKDLNGEPGPFESFISQLKAVNEKLQEWRGIAQANPLEILKYQSIYDSIRGVTQGYISQFLERPARPQINPSLMVIYDILADYRNKATLANQFHVAQQATAEILGQAEERARRFTMYLEDLDAIANPVEGRVHDRPVEPAELLTSHEVEQLASISLNFAEEVPDAGEESSSTSSCSSSCR